MILGKRLRMDQSEPPVPGLESILSKNLNDSDYDSTAAFDSLATMQVLIVGAGGLGCEILKTLALMGFQKIHIIDMDTIDLTNLNRQFLFRHADIGKSKAQVAAKFVAARVAGVEITPHFCRIEDKDDEFYRSINIVICGLDSVEARRWINAKIVSLLDDTPESLRPIIDGGTEGMSGQSRVILPGISSCYECTIDMLPEKKTFPLCTIASNPRLPEHCIEWASVVAWPKEFTRKADNDDPQDIAWLFKKAQEWGNKHNISGITLELTQGVVKRIIPAISATNAIIASELCTEAFKLATSCADILDNCMEYSALVGQYINVQSYAKNPECLVCGVPKLELKVDSSATLQQVINLLVKDPNFRIESPSLSVDGKPLYMINPGLEEMLRPNLSRPIAELFSRDDEIAVTDASLANGLKLVLEWDQ